MNVRPEQAREPADAAELQAELRDLLCLAVVGDHVRFVLTGDDAPELAARLADATVRWRELAELVAQRLVALGVPPDGRVRSLARDIPLNWVPDGWLGGEDARRLVGDRLHVVTGWARERRSQAADPATAAVFDAVCSGLEQMGSSPDSRPSR